MEEIKIKDDMEEIEYDMEEIKIVDNFLNDFELKNFYKNIINEDLVYGQGGGEFHLVTCRYFSLYKLGGIDLVNIRKKVQQLFSSAFKIKREYVGILIYGSEGTYHFDDLDKNSYTFCLYLNNPKIDDKEIENAKGEFFIKIPGKKEIVQIDTKLNRAIIFPGRYSHQGCPYSKDYTNQRICFTFKLVVK